MVLRPNIHDILHCWWSVDLGSVRKVCRRWGEGAAEGFTNFSKKKFISQQTIDLNGLVIFSENIS